MIICSRVLISMGFPCVTSLLQAFAWHTRDVNQVAYCRECKILETEILQCLSSFYYISLAFSRGLCALKSGRDGGSFQMGKFSWLKKSSSDRQEKL